ncbi:uncharacterized protein LOC143363786 [Halictus rubicundus]|uniref:uncharacterized protein LOC143363786 n=1 Tax=Halictus rubicundus TaxID=77578 RepID=UPI004035E599
MSQFEELLHKQNQTLRSIERALSNFKKLGQAKMTSATTQNRMAALKEAFNQAQDLDARLNATADPKAKSSHPYFADNVFEAAEDNYLEASDFMAEVLKIATAAEPASSKGVSTSPIPTSRPTARLPQIQLPSFDGSFEAWESFRDRFSSMVIDEPSLANVDRLHFLCSSLKGEASNAIAHLPITDQNFAVAWELITSRYENKRRLITTHLTTLFSLPQVNSESSRELRDLRDRINVSTQALRNLKRPVDQWSDIIVFLGVQKLDRSSRKAWELKLENANEFPTYAEFDTFLESRSRALEAMAPIQIGGPTDTVIVKRPKTKSLATHATAVSTATCSVCRQNHLIYRCPTFVAQSPSDRYNIIKTQRRCINCFSAKHASAQCTSQHHCKECKQRHHTLLHFPRASDDQRVANPNPAVASDNEPTISANLVSDSPTRYGVLLSTAHVQVHSPHGRRTTVRALLDQGSAATLISERTAQLLRLHRTRTLIRVTGIGETQSVANSTVRITVSPARKDQPAYSTTAVILKTLTSYVPPKKRTDINWSHLSDLELADRNPMSSEPIDLIIGADLYSQVIVGGIRRGLPATPVAQNTTLGWILSGPVASSPTLSSIGVHHCANVEQLDQALRRFWEIEEISTCRFLTKDDEQCENHFRETHTRDPDGRYVVRLPFRHEPPLELGDSRLAALRSLQRVEQRLRSNPAHAALYQDFLREYEVLGHMRQTPRE